MREGQLVRERGGEAIIGDDRMPLGINGEADPNEGGAGKAGILEEILRGVERPRGGEISARDQRTRDADPRKSRNMLGEFVTAREIACGQMRNRLEAPPRAAPAPRRFALPTVYRGCGSGTPTFSASMDAATQRTLQPVRAKVRWKRGREDSIAPGPAEWRPFPRAKA